MAKATVESCASIDIRQWQSKKVGDTFTWKWAVGEQVRSITVDVRLSRIVLRYQVPGPGGNSEKIEDPIWLDETTSLGRRRLWFRCPECGRRVALLYAGSKYFRCRGCLGLVYGSQHEDPFWRAVRRVRKNRMKFGGSPSLYDPFPRPRYMRWKRHDRMMKEEEKVFLESTKRAEEEGKAFLKSIKMTEEERKALLIESIMRFRVSFAVVEKDMAKRGLK